MDKDFRTTKRRWIKFYPGEIINGSLRWQLTAAERSVWYELMLFASLCSNTGDICDRDGKPFPYSFIANRLNITGKLFRSTLKKCIDEGRIAEDDAGLHIVNWSRYQSEYDRQKPYRQGHDLQRASELDTTPLTSIDDEDLTPEPIDLSPPF